MLKIGNKIQIENKRKKAIIDQLIEHKFKPDPVKVWKEEQRKKEMEKNGEVVEAEEEEDSNEVSYFKLSLLIEIERVCIWLLIVKIGLLRVEIGPI
jgi:hypothetical protein